MTIAGQRKLLRRTNCTQKRRMGAILNICIRAGITTGDYAQLLVLTGLKTFVTTLAGHIFRRGGWDSMKIDWTPENYGIAKITSKLATTSWRESAGADAMVDPARKALNVVPALF